MTSRVSIAWAASIAVAVLLVPAQPSATDQQKIYVAVADNRGRPVRGLTAADFRIAIDDTVQEIVSVAPATEPLSIVLLTDRLGLEAAYTPVRPCAVASDLCQDHQLRCCRAATSR